MDAVLFNFALEQFLQVVNFRFLFLVLCLLVYLISTPGKLLLVDSMDKICLETQQVFILLSFEREVGIYRRELFHHFIEKFEFGKDDFKCLAQQPLSI